MSQSSLVTFWTYFQLHAHAFCVFLLSKVFILLWLRFEYVFFVLVQALTCYFIVSNDSSCQFCPNRFQECFKTKFMHLHIILLSRKSQYDPITFVLVIFLKSFYFHFRTHLLFKSSSMA